eukprot:CAMPEP_0115098868 /NCGR_PEP_ID=MMETSP0227-20121206/31459_1 /TAXON_ID=89957 /ORGANISM="Polarella glacialis, Strain CCMP 1383" /LENGTH=36 /DNA_ID= /DNA_START= /DNA_END= /DNA_ORIENTATION=
MLLWQSLLEQGAEEEIEAHEERSAHHVGLQQPTAEE